MLRWSLGDPGDPYALAAARAGGLHRAALPGLPPFFGGAVGVFAYDLVRTVEPLGEPNPDPLGVPDLALMLTDALVAFDHLKHTVTVIANVYVSDDEDLEASYNRACDTIAEVRWRLERAGPASRAGARDPTRTAPAFQSNMERARVRGDRQPDHRVHLRRRRLSGRPLAALVGRRSRCRRSRSIAG